MQKQDLPSMTGFLLKTKRNGEEECEENKMEADGSCLQAKDDPSSTAKLASKQIIILLKEIIFIATMFPFLLPCYLFFKHELRYKTIDIPGTLGY